MVQQSRAVIDVWKNTWSVYRYWAIGVSLLLVGLTGISGCGPVDGRLAISGLVTVDGKPLDGAAINFRPALGSSGHSSGGPVQAGNFRVSAEKGLMPGTYRVTIIAMKKTGRMIEDPQKGRVPELVQVKFQKLPGEVNVIAGDANEFQFKLISAP
ncbi:MAG: hypothetical protein ABGX16_06090 [Pirellulales bacterium]